MSGYSRLLSTALVVTLAVTLAPAPSAVAAAPTAGSAGAGDPYFPLDGNGGYDVRHYNIKIRYRPGSGSLRGRTVVRATATQDLLRFNLDLALRADSVRVAGKPAAFRRDGPHELVVRPRRPLSAGQRFHAVIRYHHRDPARVVAAGTQPFFHASPGDGKPGEGLALNQPQIGPWWFPANETPADKATYSVRVTVPRKHQVLANGELVSRRAHGAWRTWRWRMTDPMATYLAFFAAGRFTIERVGPSARVPYPAVYAVSHRLRKSDQRRAMRLMRRTRGVVRWLERQLGDYPFATIGGVTTGIDTGFALETQGRPTYPLVGGPSASNVALVVHENAHQWFGDSVAVSRWRDVWLNEGFATYMEKRYAETRGRETVAGWLHRTYRAHGRDDPLWRLQVTDPGPGRIFAGAVYVRGAMTLAALRQRIGTATFTTLLRRWVEEHRHGNVTTADFRALAQQVAGQDLRGFFATWLEETGRPERTAANGLA